MKAPDLLARLSEIEAEAERALEGLDSGAIPKGVSALQKVKHIAADALHEAHPNKEESRA